MIGCILTESTFAGFLISRILSDEEKSDIEIRAVGGLSSIYSVARTFLASRRTPVVLVLDADSPEPAVASQRRQMAEEVVGDVASGVPYKVIVAVPEMEILLFRRPELLRRLFGEALTDHVVELAQYSTRGALQKLAPGELYDALRRRILRAMTADDFRDLHQSDLIQELIGFLQSIRERSESKVRIVS
jgi:hypothetical protein